MLNKILLTFIALFLSLCIKATEVYICHYNYAGNYSCDLISDKSTEVKKESDPFDFSIYIPDVDELSDTEIVGD